MIRDEVLHPLQRRRGCGVSGILFLKRLLRATVAKKAHFFVKRDHGPPVEGAASFHTTRWTIVMSAVRQLPDQAVGSFCTVDFRGKVPLRVLSPTAC